MEEGTIWYYENEAPRLGLRVGYAIENILKVVDTPYQKLQILESRHFGRMLILDSCVMLTERDEFIYHEMITHPAVFAHQSPRSLLVIGGGDGGTLREAARHPSLERLVLCEIDEAVIQASREYFPGVAKGFDDPRVELVVGDAIEYVKGHKNEFDVIIIDSADPIGPGVGLFQAEFYQHVHNALRPGGVMTAQGESPYLHRKTVRDMHKALRSVFGASALYSAFIPTYPSGWWSFAFASKGVDACSAEAISRIEAAGFQTRYHTAAVQRAAFVLPPVVSELLEDGA